MKENLQNYDYFYDYLFIFELHYILHSNLVYYYILTNKVEICIIEIIFNFIFNDLQNLCIFLIKI